MKIRAGVLDMEIYQDPDGDQTLHSGGKILDNAADDLKIIAGSKLTVSWFLPKEAIRFHLDLFEQQARPGTLYGMSRRKTMLKNKMIGQQN